MSKDLLQEDNKNFVIVKELLTESNYGYQRSHQTQLGAEFLGQPSPTSVQTELLKGYRSSYQTAQDQAQDGSAPGPGLKMYQQLGTLIDTEDPKFASIKDEDFKAWQSSVQGLCGALNSGTDEYYRRRLGVYRCLLNKQSDRNDNLPSLSSSQVILSQQFKDAILTNC